MSGVVGRDGVQWERCNCCASWCKLGDLAYEHPSPQWQHGRDLCPRCAELAQVDGRQVTMRPKVYTVAIPRR